MSDFVNLMSPANYYHFYALHNATFIYTCVRFLRNLWYLLIFEDNER